MARPKKDESAEPKVKKPKAAKKTRLELTAPAIGHNSGEVIPEVQTKISEIIAGDDEKKVITKHQRDVRNFLKEKYGISAGVLAHEIRMQKLDRTVRIQFESGHHDLKQMTGYQLAMDLKPDTIARTEHEFVDPSDPEAEANKLAGVAR